MKNKISIDDASHPLRQMAIRIIEEVVEFRLMTDIKGELYYSMEDDIVTLLTNLTNKDLK